MSALLAVDGLVRTFGGVTAVDQVTFEIVEGEIAALIGPNGAGKTTVFNLVSGFLPVSEGHVRWRGRDITREKAAARAGLGLLRTFQQPRVFAGLTVRQNLTTATHAVAPARSLADFAGTRAARRRDRDRQAMADELIDRFGLGAHAERRAGDLPYGLRKRLGVVLGVAAGPTLLLLDEPAAGLNELEIEHLRADLRQVRDSGITVCIVEHHMGLVMSISDRVMVLDSGRLIAEGPPDVVAKDERVLAAYLGTDAA